MATGTMLDMYVTEPDALPVDTARDAAAHAVDPRVAMACALDAAREEGAAAERAAIVAYVRAAPEDLDLWPRTLAESIERGDHRRC